MNNSEGQTQEPVGGMKWEDVQILARKHAEQIIEMGWRDSPDKDDIIADFISGYASAPPPAPTEQYEVYKEEKGMLHGWYQSSPIEYEKYPADKRRIVSGHPIKTEGEDEKEIHANDTFFYEIIGRLTRENEWLKDTESKKKEWLREAKKEAGFHDNISFDDVWKAVLSAYKNAAPPSPVGIDVDVLAKKYADDIWESVPMEVQYIYLNLISAFKAGFSASLPQSSTEEECYHPFKNVGYRGTYLYCNKCKSCL